MAISDDLEEEVDSILSTTWSITEGTAVPETEDIALQGGGRKLDVVMLYADLADSTALVSHNRQMAAKIFKSFLGCCTRIIRHRGGHIRSFDGDRVMGVFIGDSKNSAAGKAALNIKWAFDEILKPKLDAKYEKIRDGTLTLGYTTGMDSGEILAVRAGIRGNNDLLWVGRAANIAAKLSGLRKNSYRSFATKAVFDKFADDVKTTDGKNMWTKFEPWGDAGVIYGSTWRWKP